MLHVWRPPEPSPGLRIDSGVEEGSEIGVYYDPLLAKVIAHAKDRESATRKLTHALRNFSTQGVQTNREFLIAVLESNEFKAGKAHTGFQLPVSKKADEELERIYCAVTRACIEQTEHARRTILPSIPPRFRNNPTPAPVMKFAVGEREYQIGDSRGAIDILYVGKDHVDALVKGVRYRFDICSMVQTITCAQAWDSNELRGCRAFRKRRPAKSTRARIHPCRGRCCASWSLKGRR